MKKRKPTRKPDGLLKIFLGLFLLLLDSVFLSGQPQPKIKILTSIYPFYEFAQTVSGDRGEVQILLPPGSEVHTWKPKPSDIIKLNETDLFIGVGSILEPWLDEILESIDNPNLRILEADKLVSLMADEEKEHTHGHAHEGQDPHLWLDFQNDIQIVEAIRAILTEIEPSHADLFSKNADAYIIRLNNIDKKFRDTLKSCSTRVLILGGHSAFGYMAERYSLNQIAVYGTSPDAQPSPKQIVDIIGMAQTNSIKAVFYEMTVSSDIARMIAREIGAQVLPLNPAASLTRNELRSGIDFFKIMEKNLENLKIGLRCK
jgi:zinc transport system substrate-binding protein